MTVQFVATDPNGDAISYSASGLPPEATFDQLSQVFTWTPGFGQEGSYEVRFEASDENLADSRNVTITVTDTPE